jgi:hypothetical protein
MKDNPSLLKKWLSIYLILSSLLFLFDYFWSYTSISFWTLKPLLVNLFSFTVTFFCYLKITKKSIGWSLSTIFLAYFLSVILTLFITTMMNSSSNSAINYILFRFFWIIFNTLFMFAGVFSEKKTKIKNWNDDILDDTNI